MLFMSISSFAQSNSENWPLTEVIHYDDGYSTLNPKFEFKLAMNMSYLPCNFSEFKSALGDDNVARMNFASGTLDLELGGTYKKYYLGISLGFGSITDFNNDSLNIRCRENQFGLNFGYHLIDSRLFRITPKAGLMWHRYKLINSELDSKIPLEQYIVDRDLDIRFHQTLGVVGLNTEYKVWSKDLWPHAYLTIGLFGGYCFKLNDKPRVYSKYTRLTTNNEIQFDNYILELNFALNFR